MYAMVKQGCTIYGEGYGEYSRFICTSHGGPYALALAKYLLDPNKNVFENVRRIAYIISWIAEEVDSSVVFMFRDGECVKEESIVEPLGEDIISEMVGKVRDHKKKLSTILEFEK